MRNYGNLFLSLNGCLTYGTLSTIGKTGFGTGCRLARNGFLGVRSKLARYLLGKLAVTGTGVISLVTCYGTGGFSRINELDALVICNFDRIEVVVTIYRSNGKGGILKSNVGIPFCGDLFTVVNLVRGVSGIAVNNNLGARLYDKLEGAVLNLRIIATVVADLNTGEVNDRILVVTLRTEVDSSIFGYGSVYVCLKRNALKICLGICSFLIGNDNYLCFFLNCEGKYARHIGFYTVKVYVKYAVACAMTGNGNGGISGNYELNAGISTELVRVTVVSELANKNDLAVCLNCCKSVCGCKIKAVCIIERRNRLVTYRALTVFILMTCGSDLLLSNEGFATYRALLTLGKSCLSTGCSLACYSFLGVRSYGCLLLSYESLATYGALLTLGKSCLGTGCSLCGKDLFLVTCGDLLLSNEDLTTYRALLTLGKSCLGTGCSLCGKNLLGVTESSDLFLSYESLATYRALLALGKTFRGTGCGAACNNFF